MLMVRYGRNLGVADLLFHILKNILQVIPPILKLGMKKAANH